MIKNGEINLKAIMLKNPKLRVSDEIEHMATFLQYNVTYFRRFDKQLLI
jgi:CRP-like cAMP-binding protein